MPSFVSRQYFLLTFLTLGTFSSLATVRADEGTIVFGRDIRPLLSDRCYACHGFDEGTREGELRLDVREDAIKKGAIIAGNPEKSELMKRITSKDEDVAMPPKEAHKKALTPEQIELFRTWIKEGAHYSDHWAYTKLEKPAPPKTNISGWNSHPIDQFIGAGLESGKFTPAEQADRRTLIRRLSVDLLGLPASPDQVEKFIADKDPKAYDKLVDELLASEHYGERMAQYWLDLVRFADTAGYHSDKYREVSAYRDSVIKAFNKNLPFDQFTKAQLAGDLLPESTIQQKILSGYNRMLQTTDEGGAQAKEYQAIYQADRVRNVSTVWLGTTLGCCQCHDHKYDPFTMRDFYSMGAFFADIKERVIGSQPANLKIPDAASTKRIAELDKQIAELKKKVKPFDYYDGNLRVQGIGNASHLDLSGEVKYAINLGGNNVKIGSVTFKKDDPKAIEGYTADLDPGKGNAGAHATKELNTLYGSFRWTTKADKSLQFKVEPNQTYLVQLLIREPVNQKHNRKYNINIDGKPLVQLFNAVPDQARWPNESITVSTIVKSTGDTLAVQFPLATVDKGVDRNPFINGILIAKVDNKIASLQPPKEYQAFDSEKKKWITETLIDIPAAKKKKVPGNVIAALQKKDTDLTYADNLVVHNYYRSINSDMKASIADLAKAQKEVDTLRKNVRTTLISESTTPRMIRILERGNWMDDTGEVVQPNTPGTLFPLGVKDRRATRLDLANWMVDKQNPLTARVFVNRIWYLMFGRGIATSLEDFGQQGTWPSHPELLDYLAAEFVESGWDIKHLVKMIVTSKAYQQSSLGKPNQITMDPLNERVSRQNRFRMEAEFIRDNALIVSGLFVNEGTGKSLKPYQPAGFWQHLNFPARTYKHDVGKEQYRRGLYTYVCRTFPHPSLTAFDAPSREECIAQRSKSNTPLQALVLLNDPTYVEAARNLATRVIQSEKKSPNDRIQWLFREVLARKATEKEMTIILKVHQEQNAKFAADKDSAMKLVQVGLSPVPETVDKTELAVWTSISRVMLNLHETITRY